METVETVTLPQPPQPRTLRVKNPTAQPITVSVRVPVERDIHAVDDFGRQVVRHVVTQESKPITWQPGEVKIVPEHVIVDHAHRYQCDDRRCSAGGRKHFCHHPFEHAGALIIGGVAPLLVVEAPQQAASLHPALLPSPADERPKPLSPADVARRLGGPGATEAAPILERARRAKGRHEH